MKISGKICNFDGCFNGTIEFDETVTRVTEGATTSNDFIIPGFIDVQVNGGAGRDFSKDSPDHWAAIFEAHVLRGTTTLLPTFVSLPADDLSRRLDDLSERFGEICLGVHIEGPFFDADYLGAHNIPFTPRYEDYGPVLSREIVRIITGSGGHAEALQALSPNAIIQLGHTNSAYDQASTLHERGVIQGLTHIHNAMAAFDKRNPNLFVAAANHNMWGQIIFDGIHVASEVVQLTLNACPRVFLTSDASAAAGAAPGAYALGDQQVYFDGEAVRTAAGVLAGSAITMFDGFRNLLELNFSICEAVNRSSHLPSVYLGLHDRGRIRSGAAADFIVLAPDLTIKSVFAGGRCVTG